MLGQNIRHQLKRNKRHGAVAVEAALVYPLFLWILLAMMDLGLVALRSNALSDAARRTAREVMLRGTLANDGPACWGPQPITTTAAADSEVLRALPPTLPTMAPDQVDVSVHWPDDGNQPGDRVRVELRFVHQPLVPGLLPWGPLDLHASTVMSIVN
ncbi:TadE/TadG family type IV pilus assembly protein [Roseimaritima sediminicola]|uniref:TadE/TadG family type IV pilus assembly protein n=1 Tax=Roseimaritima sediminicola TaxID=2662066 RepID=UPI0012985108|nr:TadE family protein [Roseimaritima sediminicola]